ncbi:MAG: hypothetical protein RBR42_01175 [Desulfomicrobium sp.]|jgi:predicted Fe-Mo cluster-binding NifX family protein|nr:hypothetical protein [Desulfomicrobium sp.]
MARIAIHYWQDHIAPVFDTGGPLLVIDGNTREKHMLIQTLPLARAQELVQVQVDHLICGALSRPMHEAIVGRGITITGFVTGEIEAVLTAWTLGRLDSTFAMPGCGGAMRGRFGKGQRQFQRQRRTVCHKEMVQDREAWGLKLVEEPGYARPRKKYGDKAQAEDME